MTFLIQKSKKNHDFLGRFLDFCATIRNQTSIKSCIQHQKLTQTVSLWSRLVDILVFSTIQDLEAVPDDAIIRDW